MKLKDRVALITGAGSGIGKEIALTFAREGAKIGINDVAADRVKTTLKQIEDLGCKGLELPADVGDSHQVKGMFAKLVERFGTVDILVNNAGVGDVAPKVWDNLIKAAEQRMAGVAPKTSLGATRYMTDEAWQRMLTVHLFGTFYCTREALAIMEDKAYGKIINIASITGISGLPGFPHYSASKGGIIAFTKAVAPEVIGRGVYVNAIAPGWIDTAMGDERSSGAMGKLLGLPLALAIPIGRLGTVAEMASLALFLASDDSSYIVGQVISPNGGSLT